MARRGWGVGSLLLLLLGVLPACAPGPGGAGEPLECRLPVPLDELAAHAEEDGLPVFHLFFAGSLPDEDGDHVAWLVYRGHCYRLQAKLRGASSLQFPKRSYTLKFPRGAPFQEPLLAGGFTGRRKLVLITSFNDNSYIRHRLAFTLWNRMSPEHLQVKTYSAILYIDGRYEGLYTAADHIDEHLLALQGMDPQGELFKAVSLDANFSRQLRDGQPKADLSAGYEKKAGLPETGSRAYESVRELTAFVADSSPELFRQEWGRWLETRDYQDWWIFSTLVFANDSVAKNAYHYRARGPLSRWRFIPWDLDSSFGQAWNTRRTPSTERATFTRENFLFTRLLADPALAEPLRERYHKLLQGELRAEVVLGLIDQYAREVGAAARRDEARWNEEFRAYPRWSDRTDFTTHEQELEYLRQWVRTRWSALEQQLP